MQKRKRGGTASGPGPIERLKAAVDEEKKPAEPSIAKRNPAGSSTAPNVMKHIPSGAGAASERSGQGGKSGGGMGGQKAGGIKGGGKRKTHAGTK